MEHEKGAQILGSASSRHWTECLDGLIQLKQRICALGLIREGEVKQVDLEGLCARLAKGMPATGSDASDDSSSCMVQAPSQLTEAVMMVLGREVLGVALELRERKMSRMRRKAPIVARHTKEKIFSYFVPIGWQLSR